MNAPDDDRAPIMLTMCLCALYGAAVGFGLGWFVFALVT